MKFDILQEISVVLTKTDQYDKYCKNAFNKRLVFLINYNNLLKILIISKKMFQINLIF